MRYVRPERRLAAPVWGLYPSCSIAATTRSRVALASRPRPRTTLETVCRDTPAASATSSIVARWRFMSAPGGHVAVDSARLHLDRRRSAGNDLIHENRQHEPRWRRWRLSRYQLFVVLRIACDCGFVSP